MIDFTDIFRSNRQSQDASSDLYESSDPGTRSVSFEEDSETTHEDRETQQAIAIYNEMTRLSGMMDHGEDAFRNLCDMVLTMHDSAKKLRERNRKLKSKIVVTESEKEELLQVIDREKTKSDDLRVRLAELQKLLEEESRKDVDVDEQIVKLSDEIKSSKRDRQDLMDQIAQLEDTNRTLTMRIDNMNKMANRLSISPNTTPPNGSRGSSRRNSSQPQTPNTSFMKPIIEVVSREVQTDPIYKTTKMKEIQTDLSMVQLTVVDRKVQCFPSEFPFGEDDEVVVISSDEDDDPSWRWFRRIVLLLLVIAATSNVIEVQLANDPYVSWQSMLGVEIVPNDQLPII